VNRTYFGLYTMLADLNAEIAIRRDAAWRDDLLKYWKLR
jgi:hypothetical protein